MRISFLILILMLCKSLIGQPEKPALRITPLTDSFYVFTTYQIYGGTPFPSNGMYVLTSAGAVMIDSPWDTTQFQPLLDSILLKHQSQVVLCLATHSHKDRTNALEFLQQKGIKTYTSLQTDRISKIKNEKRAESVFTKDTLFQVGGQKMQTYYAGPGHTSDNIVVWFEGVRILYGGCLVKSTEAKDLGNLADANVKAWPGTIKKIQDRYKNPRFIIPGHQAWTDHQALNHTLALLSDFQKKQ